MAVQTRRANKDAHMGKALGGSFSGWNGKEDHLIVGVNQPESYKYRTVINFNIDFTPMLSIEDATLTLYDAENDSTHTEQTATPTSVDVALMTADWGEGSIDPGEGNLTSSLDWHWDNRFDKFAFPQVTQNVTQGSDGDTQTFDVTALVQEWFSGARNNRGFMVKANNETDGNRGLSFFSQNHSNSNRHPKLDITYTTNTAPGKPQLYYPKSSQVINDKTPTFSATSNDVDSDDYITGIQLEVYEPPYRVFKYDTSTTAADPGTGDFRFNNADPDQVTFLYVSETDADGAASGGIMGSLDDKYIVVTSSSGTIVTYQATANATDNGTWRTIPVVWFSTEGNVTGGFTAASRTVIEFKYDAATAFDAATLKWQSGIVNQTNHSTEFSIVYGSEGSSTPLVGGTFYKWRAKTKDKGSAWSPWSDWETFIPNTVPNVPSLTIVDTPVSAIRDITPEFTVTHNDPDPGDTDIYAYQVIVEGSDGSDWSEEWNSGQVDTSGSLSATKTVTSGTLAWQGSYRVKARTKDKQGSWSSYSPWKTFGTHKTGTPINRDPSGSEAVSATPTFTADRASSADTIVSYQIVLYNDSLTELWNSGTISTGITGGASISKIYPGSPSLTAGNAYKWKIRFTGSIGGTSDYSALATFVVVDATTPTITAPVGTAITDLTPDIVMTRASVFNRLQVELYPDINPSNGDPTTTSNLGTPITSSGTKADADADTIITGAGPTTGTWTYSGTALDWATKYKIRSRVSSDGGSNWSSWSGLTSFTTDTAEAPVLTSVAGEAQSGTPVISDSTPTFLITRGGSDTIDQMRVRVFNNSETVVIWDSGMTDVTNATTASLTYSGSELIPGTTYRWTARYKKTTGPTGPEAEPLPFRLNAPPSIPSSLFPSNGHVFRDGVDDLEFEADFVDSDVGGFGDTPTQWHIIVEEDDGTPHGTMLIESGLVVGVNRTLWTGPTLLTSVDYRWRTRFTDTLGPDVGAYSGWRGFSLSTAPNAEIITPSSGFPTPNVQNTVTPEIDWNITVGGPQLSYIMDIDEADEDGASIKNVTQLTATTSTTSKTIPAGYLKDGKYYRIVLTVRNEDLLYDEDPEVRLLFIQLDAPDPITGLVVTTNEERSLVRLNWNTHTLSANHEFVSYYIYRRLWQDEDWQFIGRVNSRTTSEYDDWYAGHSVKYEYRVSAVTTKSGVGIEMESGDDPDGGNISVGVLESDVWMIVGASRSAEAIQEIPVVSETHNRPVQQESFETLGSNRKVIVRGFVLGHEGSISAIWDNRRVVSETEIAVFYNYTVVGRRLLDYITKVKGPHILKSPFGDVWDVEFEGPDYEWTIGGHLQVDLNWIETGDTSRVSI